MHSTIKHYNSYAQSFFQSTLEVDMGSLYDRFLPWLPEGAHILDAGCGSGRDTLAFLNMGFQVTAFDAASELAVLAEEYSGCPVQVLSFEEVEWTDAFEGIWACASLLHVTQSRLPDAFTRLARALKPKGVLYVSFKYGKGERSSEGRHFTDLDELGLREITKEIPHLQILDIWQTGDQRPERKEQCWLNALLQKREVSCPDT